VQGIAKTSVHPSTFHIAHDGEKYAIPYFRHCTKAGRNVHASPLNAASPAHQARLSVFIAQHCTLSAFGAPPPPTSSRILPAAHGCAQDAASGNKE
jgi:hypothetical protein